jgi:hypothetical protein
MGPTFPDWFDRFTSRRAVRRIFFAGALPALGLALIIASRTGTPPEAVIAQNRASSLETASALLDSLGVQVSKTGAQVHPSTIPEALLLVSRRIRRDEPLPVLAPHIRIKVTFTGQDGADDPTVVLGPGGRWLEYTLPSPPQSSAAERAAAFARQFPGLTLPSPSASKVTDGEPETVYDFADPTVAGMSHRLTVTRTALRLETKYPPAITGSFKWRSGIQKGLDQVAKLFLLIAGIYAIILFRGRMREKEIPWTRALILAAGMTLLGAIAYTVNSDLLGDGTRIQMPNISRYLIFGLTGAGIHLAGGLLLGVVYSATEGEIREAHPGKLLSLDAVLSGQILCRPVAVAVCVGVAMGCWFLLFAVLAFALSGQWLALAAAHRFQHLLSWSPPVSQLTEVPLQVVWAIIAGLLAPVAWRHRHPAWPRLGKALLLIVPVTVAAGFADYTAFSAASALTAILWGAAMLAAFEAGGALAAMNAAVFAQLFIESAGMVSARGAQSYSTFLIAVAWLAPFAYAALRGRPVDEERARPAHAHRLSERLALRAQAQAARAAQLHLMPTELPEFSGVASAAVCHPAGAVAGDFYDFIPLNNGRMAVLLASGSGPGLPSALTIALAKGFLTCELHDAPPPVAALESFQREFGHLLSAPSSAAGLALLYIGAGDTVVEAARIGAHPSLWLVGESGPGRVEWSDGGTAQQASFKVPPDATMLLFTRGLVELLADQSGEGQRKWLESAMRKLPSRSPAALQQALMARLFGRKPEKALKDLPFDLTLMAFARQEPPEAAGAGERAA